MRRPTHLSLLGEVTQSVVLSTQRAGGQEVRLTAVPGRDVVVMHVDRGPALVLHPENARDLLLAQGDATRTRSRCGGRGPRADATAVARPRSDRADARERAGVPRGRDAESDRRGHRQGRRSRRGLHRVGDRQEGRCAGKGGRVPALAGCIDPAEGLGTAHTRATAAEGPDPRARARNLLLDQRTFGKLWTEHPQRVRALFEKYESAVYALDHATLGASPIDNALTLARALPAGADVHLLTHSRGGLVAEVLARLAANPRSTFKPFAGKDHRAHLAALKSLASILDRPKQKIAVSRVVRVACPARGTLLASKRLDAYSPSSSGRWSSPDPRCPPARRISRRGGAPAADPETIPGLAAQIPDNPLVQWLHEPEVQIPGDLRVVAGDIEGDSVTGWLKTLLADAFYWTDNDLVVQTRSMYGGTPREKGATYLLDQGGKVTHFNYFSNDRTSGAIVSALVDTQPRGFGEIGPLSWAGASATGTRAAVRRASQAGPIGRRCSSCPASSAATSASTATGSGSAGVSPTACPRCATPRARRTASSRTVRSACSTTTSPRSCRRPTRSSRSRSTGGARWKTRHGASPTPSPAALDARKQSGKPVRLLAHSMGGIVARTMELVSPKVWSRMMAHPDSRLLMLGTPNAGSWAPMQVLSGDDTFGNLIVTIGAPFKTAQTRQMIAEFPGLMQLQAGLEADGLKKQARWKELADEDLRRLASEVSGTTSVSSSTRTRGASPRSPFSTARRSSARSSTVRWSASKYSAIAWCSSPAKRPSPRTGSPWRTKGWCTSMRPKLETAG
jgi:hypothetical protein